MLKRILLAALCAILLATVLSAPLAAQAAAPNYFAVTSIQVKLGHQGDYEAAVKKMIEAMRASGENPLFASTSTSSPGRYTFAQPLATLADFGVRTGSIQKFFQANPKVLEAIQKNSEFLETTLYVPRPDLSFVPAEPRLSEAETSFSHVTRLYVRRDRVADFEAMIPKFAAGYKKAGVADGWRAAEAITGEGPLYLVITGAASEADFYVQQAKNNEKLGDAGRALLAEVGPMIRRIENSSGVARPDLSVVP